MIFFFQYFDYFCAQMRVVLFFVSLFFLLLCGRQNLHAAASPQRNSYSTSQTLAKSEQLHFVNADHDITIIEEADVDLDEEHVSGEDLKTELLHKTYGLPDRWYLNFFPALILNDYHKHFEIFPPFCGQSSPIYIRQRVLRI